MTLRSSVMKYIDFLSAGLPKDLLLKHARHKSGEGPWDSFWGTRGLVLELMSLLWDIYWYL